MKKKQAKARKATVDEINMGLRVIALEEQLQKIAAVLERVDIRCMAADGPVTKTQTEITNDELRQIYELATIKGARRSLLDVSVSRKGKEWGVTISVGVQSFDMRYTSSLEECQWYAHMLRMAFLRAVPVSKNNAKLFHDFWNKFHQMWGKARGDEAHGQPGYDKKDWNKLLFMAQGLIPERLEV